MIDKVKRLFEKYAFGVCSWLGDKLGIDPSRIRIYFIYASCATLGSVLLPYLVLAFLLRLKEYIKPKRTRVWDL